MVKKTSRIPGFSKLTLEQRIQKVAEFADFSPEMLKALIVSPDTKLSERMMECSAGWFNLPLGFVPNVIVNGREYLVPYAIEEPSNISGPAKMASLVREGGSLEARYHGSIMAGQLQIINLPSMQTAREAVEQERDNLLKEINCQKNTINASGGGAKAIEAKPYFTAGGNFLVIQVEFDVLEGFGAGHITRSMEEIAPTVERLTKGEANLSILTNYAPKRLVDATLKLPIRLLKREREGEKTRTGEEVAQRMLLAYQFAAENPQRAVTYNKGIMNGVDALLTATGNDTRAQEAAAHSYAARDGKYRPLSRWKKEGDYLVQRLQMPVTLGTIGGIIKSHSQVEMVLRILGDPSTKELSELAAAMGALQGAAANYTLVTRGISNAHGGLNLYNLATSAGIPLEYLSGVVEEMRSLPRPSSHAARQIYEKFLAKNK
ncbi:hydroxymethylglutaryl-CoA reductase, degradative [Candidatus Woesearchaeota archaeon]|nr:hydroxymethylglutaryl-CoA reductase, degradative [Candidatus Woesearchaeota archaeon]